MTEPSVCMTVNVEATFPLSPYSSQQTFRIIVFIKKQSTKLDFYNS